MEFDKLGSAAHPRLVNAYCQALMMMMMMMMISCHFTWSFPKGL
jgi:hypothetical protein